MGTKNNPGAFDCYANAEPDEPMFILLGRDPEASDLVNLWARKREDLDEDPVKVLEARDCAEAMRRFCESKGKRPRPALRGLYLWSFAMHHGLTESTFYVTTDYRDITEAAAKAEAMRLDEDRFISRECRIRNLTYLGEIDS